MRNVLAPGGQVVVQAGSPCFAPRTFSCILATVRSARLRAVPYHVDVPSLGDWGFVLAGPGTAPPPRADAPEPLRFLVDDVLRAAAVFPADRAPTPSHRPPSTTRGCSASRARSGATTSWPPHSAIIMTTTGPRRS